MRGIVWACITEFKRLTRAGLHRLPRPSKAIVSVLVTQMWLRCVRSGAANYKNPSTMPNGLCIGRRPRAAQFLAAALLIDLPGLTLATTIINRRLDSATIDIANDSLVRSRQYQAVFGRCDEILGTPRRRSRLGR